MEVELLSNSNGVKKSGYQGKPITEIISNGFFTVDRNWTVKYWNKAAELLLNVSAEEIIGKNLWKEFAGLIPQDFYTVYHNSFLKDIPVHFEEYWGEMGTWFDVISYHCDDTLSVSFRSHAHSVHLNRPELELKALNELYRFVTEVTNDCLWEWDFRDEEIFWIDGGHKRVFGYQIENALVPQKFWENHIHPDDRVRVLNRLRNIIIEKLDTLWEDEYRFLRADGTYAYVHDRGHIIYDTGNVATRMIGATQDITARKLAEIKLEESEDKLMHERQIKKNEVTQAVILAQENERSEIGKELHDNLNQILGAAKLYIEMAKTDDENREMCLEKSTDYIMKVIEEIRKISKTLAIPGMIMGLFESINLLLDDLLIIHAIQIEFIKDDIQEEDLNKILQFTIFRIVQEQLNNILKHAKATHAIIHLSKLENEIELSISDNGQGCNILEEEQGIGNFNIKSRAELYQGRIAITSKPGEGYELKVILPLNARKAKKATKVSD